MTTRKPQRLRLRVRWAASPPPAGSWAKTSRGAFLHVLASSAGHVEVTRHRTAPEGVTVRPWRDLIARDANPPAKMSRVDSLQRLLRSGAITQAQFTAGMRLRATLERAIPAAPVAAGRLGVPRRRITGGGAPERHARAQQAAERAIRAVGREHIPILDFCVLGNGSLARYAAAAHCHHATATASLQGALTRLADHYNPPVTGRYR